MLILVVFQVTSLNKYSEIIRSNLTKVQRLKVTALVTIEVHARDVIEKLIKTGCNDENAFEWLCQLRYYMERVIVALQYIYTCEFNFIRKYLILGYFHTSIKEVDLRLGAQLLQIIGTFVFMLIISISCKHQSNVD